MHISLLTLFPRMCEAVTAEGMMKRAMDRGILQVDCVDIRTFTNDRYQSVDDSPYGGGAGMVMKIEPIGRAMNAIKSQHGGEGKVILLSPRGRKFDDAAARRLAEETRLTFICGHYEGIDERVSEKWVEEEFSLGDFVMTGGELAALSMMDAIVRYLPGVLGNESSTKEESFADGMLEYPHYTRPAEYEGLRVPEVLLSGNHQAIQTWRRRESLRVTAERRPDLIGQAVMNHDDKIWLENLKLNPKEKMEVGDAARAF